MPPASRRRVLAVVAGLVGTAGCNGGTSSGDEDTTPTNRVTAAPVPTTRAERSGRTSRVVAFDGVGPGNLAVDPSGAVYLAMSFAGTIRRLPAARRGATGLTGAATERVATLPTGDGRVAGLDTLDGTVYAVLASRDRATHGIWQVPTDGGEPRRLAGIQPDRQVRGLVADGNRDRLFVTHPRAGVVSTVGLADGTTTRWLTHRLVGGDGRGATGLARFGDELYVTNHGQGRVVRATIDPTGTAARPTVLADDPVNLAGAAGLAVDIDHAYVAATGLNRVVRADTDGQLQRLATAADGLNVPTDVALGPDGDTLFVTNLGFKPGVGLTGHRGLLRVAL